MFRYIKTKLLNPTCLDTQDQTVTIEPRLVQLLLRYLITNYMKTFQSPL